ncbi:MAG: thioredoxin family protein [Thermodesulfobacteriota bacterium]|nr:thioredoxin family protein [Thermodesulfobacteriota bacterium]
MPPKIELSLMLFYSNLNQESLSTRIAINEFIENNHQFFKIKATMVNYDKEKNICQQYGVTGIPTLLVFLNQELVGRHYGETTIKEIETIIKNNLKKEKGL